MQRRRYLLKLRLSQRQKLCPGCGRPLHGQGDAHEVFFRRPVPDGLLEDKINVILVHNRCHVPEAPGLNHNAALMKLCEFGPTEIEAWAKALGRSLPSWYWEAKKTYEDSTR